MCLSAEFHDELTSLGAIYGPDVLCASDPSDAEHIYILALPSAPDVRLRLAIPREYPSGAHAPAVLGTHAVGGAKADDVARVVAAVRGALGRVFTPGMPCLFDVIEEVEQEWRSGVVPTPGETVAAADGSGDGAAAAADDGIEPDQAVYEEDGDAAHDVPLWTLSDVVTEKKSVFVGRCAPVTSVDQAQAAIAHLLASDKKAARATHNISAWRIRAPNPSGPSASAPVQFQDCDDDGETAAGARLLHLLDLMGVWNVVVVVTRWYGGVQLGPDRFRIINQCAREAVVRADQANDVDREDGGRGKKKSKR